MKTFLFKSSLFTIIFLILISLFGGAPMSAAAAEVTLVWSPTTNPGSFDFGTLNAGDTSSQQFTLTDGKNSGVLTASLSGSSAFSITSDGCIGARLGKKPSSCTVTVQYAPTGFSQNDTATLTASNRKGDSASITLTGATAPPEANLLAHWKFDEGTGSTVADDSGNGHTLTLFNPGWTILAAPVAFPNLYALDMDWSLPPGYGMDDGTINLANQSFSVAIWFKRYLWTGEQSFFRQGTEENINQTLHLGLDRSDRFICGFWGNDLVTTATTTDVLSWHHYACTYDASTGLRRAYKDGVLVGSDTANGNFVGSGPVFIGGLPQGPNGLGALDDVRIYGAALSTEQVASLVQHDVNIPCNISAALYPDRVLLPPHTMQLEVSDANDCGVPLEVHWSCESATSTECANFHSYANSGPYGSLTPVITLQEGDVIQFWVEICEIGNSSNCSWLHKVYEGAVV